MKHQSAVFFFLAAMLLRNIGHAAARECNARDVPISRLELVEILRKDNFSIPLEVQDEFNRFGEIQVGNSCFVIFLYTKEYNAGPGTNVHFAGRLLVLSDYRYLGMYRLDPMFMPKRIRGSTIEFDSDKRGGNVIVFGENGPPKNVYLTGEMREFAK